VKVAPEYVKMKKSPLFKADATKWLEKTQQAGKRLGGCCGDL
jgi:hypothetical protein